MGFPCGFHAAAHPKEPLPTRIGSPVQALAPGQKAPGTPSHLGWSPYGLHPTWDGVPGGFLQSGMGFLGSPSTLGSPGTPSQAGLKPSGLHPTGGGVPRDSVPSGMESPALRTSWGVTNVTFAGCCQHGESRPCPAKAYRNRFSRGARGLGLVGWFGLAPGTGTASARDGTTDVLRQTAERMGAGGWLGRRGQGEYSLPRCIPFLFRKLEYSLPHAIPLSEKREYNFSR